MPSPFFVKNVIKTKAAELAVFHMFQEVADFLVVPFGTDFIDLDLMQLEKAEEVSRYASAIRQRPDFSIMNTKTGAHYLVEVKYRDNPTPALMLTLAQELSESWPHAHLCVVTPIGFFFDACADIIAQQGDIALIDPTIMPVDIQDKYLKVIQDTIKSKDMS